MSKSGDTATITITDKNGTTTAEITDGQDGQDGADGFSPAAGVSKSGTTATITITDKDGTTTAEVSDGEDGQDGYTPQRGTDYWTAADQAAIVADVEADLIDDTAAAGDTTKVWSADKSSSELSGVLSAIDQKAPVITQTASGDIVSFADGADGMPLSSCVVSIDPVQSGSGDPSPTNVRPISGWTGAQIGRCGETLCMISDFVQGSMSSTGSPTGSTIRLRSPRFVVQPNTKYTFAVPEGFYVYEVHEFTTSETFIKYTTVNDATGTIETSSTTGKIAWLIRKPNNATILPSEVFYALCVPGTTANVTVYPISWQTAAGTVYGGNVNPLTGVLTVDRAKITLDGTQAIGASNWRPFDGSSAWLYTPNVTNGRINTVGKIGAICDTLEEIPYGYSDAPGDEGYIYNGRIGFSSVGSSSYGLAVRVPVSGLTNNTLINAYLAEHPITIVYPISSPVTYQLDPVQITTLFGANNLWADTGAVNIEYPADTRTYVDDAISAATDPDGNVVTVTGSTPAITGESGKRYVCGTVDSISITPPGTGIIDVVFSSGTTPTVLTVPNTVRFPAWFNSASLDASTTYEINIMDGINGAVMAWQT